MRIGCRAGERKCAVAMDGGESFSYKQQLASITYGNGQYVAVGNNGPILTSPDANCLDQPIICEHIYSLPDIYFRYLRQWLVCNRGRDNRDM